MQSSPAIFEAFFSVLRNVLQEATVQYTLALLDEMLAMDPSREKDMHAPSPQHPGMPDFLVIVLLPRSRFLSFAEQLHRDGAKQGCCAHGR